VFFDRTFYAATKNKAKKSAPLGHYSESKIDVGYLKIALIFSDLRIRQSPLHCK
jgi:hypothetical protein